MPSVKPWLANKSPKMISPMLPLTLLSLRKTFVRLSVFSPNCWVCCNICCICSLNEAERAAPSFWLSLMAFCIFSMASFRGWVIPVIVSLFCSFSFVALCSSTCCAIVINWASRFFCSSCFSSLIVSICCLTSSSSLLWLSALAWSDLFSSSRWRTRLVASASCSPFIESSIAFLPPSIRSASILRSISR